MELVFLYNPLQLQQFHLDHNIMDKKLFFLAFHNTFMKWVFPLNVKKKLLTNYEKYLTHKNNNNFRQHFNKNTLLFCHKHFKAQTTIILLLDKFNFSKI